jgi:hypothetical protein
MTNGQTDCINEMGMIFLAKVTSIDNLICHRKTQGSSMKKIKLANYLLYGVGLSSILVTNCFATVNQQATVELSLTAAGFRPVTENGGFAITAADAVTRPPSGEFIKVDPNTEFGGAIGLTYHFPCSPYLVSLSYWRAHFDSDRSASGNIAITDVPANYGLVNASNATSEIDFNNDLVSLLLGAMYSPDGHFTITPKVGLSYLRVKDNESTRYVGLNIPAGASVLIEEPSIFRGIGPSVGADLDYSFGHCFSIFSTFMYSAIVGDIDSHYTANPIGLAARNYVDVNIKTEKTIVNLFQSELGLAYLFTCNPIYSGKVMVGYSLAKAFGTSENNDNFVDDINTSKFVSGISNTGFHGFFGRVNFNFNV